MTGTRIPGVTAEQRREARRLWNRARGATAAEVMAATGLSERQTGRLRADLTARRAIPARGEQQRRVRSHPRRRSETAALQAIGHALEAGRGATTAEIAARGGLTLPEARRLQTEARELFSAPSPAEQRRRVAARPAPPARTSSDRITGAGDDGKSWRLVKGGRPVSPAQRDELMNIMDRGGSNAAVRRALDRLRGGRASQLEADRLRDAWVRIRRARGWNVDHRTRVDLTQWSTGRNKGFLPSPATVERHAPEMRLPPGAAPPPPKLPGVEWQTVITGRTGDDAADTARRAHPSGAGLTEQQLKGLLAAEAAARPSQKTKRYLQRMRDSAGGPPAVEHSPIGDGGLAGRLTPATARLARGAQPPRRGRLNAADRRAEQQLWDRLSIDERGEYLKLDTAVDRRRELRRRGLR